MKKNLNKTISQLIILVIIFLSIFILFEYFTNKKISKNKLIKITITNSIPSSLMTSYFKINYKKISKKHLKIINQSNYIINCIGENQNEKKMNDINCLILDRISKNLTNKNIKYFIHISTCGVYGNLEKNLISEKELPHPYTLYSKTKLKGEKILFTNLRTKFPVIILRCSQVVGLQMRNTSIKKLSFYIKKNLFFFINNKKSIYSFIFQDDIIRCLKIIISKQLNSNKKKLIKIINNII